MDVEVTHTSTAHVLLATELRTRRSLLCSPASSTLSTRVFFSLATTSKQRQSRSWMRRTPTCVNGTIMRVFLHVLTINYSFSCPFCTFTYYTFGFSISKYKNINDLIMNELIIWELSLIYCYCINGNINEDNLTLRASPMASSLVILDLSMRLDVSNWSAWRSMDSALRRRLRRHLLLASLLRSRMRYREKK